MYLFNATLPFWEKKFKKIRLKESILTTMVIKLEFQLPPKTN